MRHRNQILWAESVQSDDGSQRNLDDKFGRLQKVWNGREESHTSAAQHRVSHVLQPLFCLCVSNKKHFQEVEHDLKGCTESMQVEGAAALKHHVQVNEMEKRQQPNSITSKSMKRETGSSFAVSRFSRVTTSFCGSCFQNDGAHQQTTSDRLVHGTILEDARS